MTAKDDKTTGAPRSLDGLVRCLCRLLAIILLPLFFILAMFALLWDITGEPEDTLFLHDKVGDLWVKMFTGI